MKMIMAKLQRFSRTRQLHTIVSKETIKPFPQTTSHLKTHNLSIMDRFAPNMYFPFIFFYPNYSNHHTKNLKQSLSQCLTQYYPLAGRFPTNSKVYVDCNDEGIEFLEATIDSRIDEFIVKKDPDETLNQLFPNGLGSKFQSTCSDLFQVQLNHFVGGGVAVAMSMSHKLADASTMGNFMYQWANFARCQTPINTSYISSPSNNIEMPELVMKDADESSYARRTFVFPNSKLNDLKNKVIGMGKGVSNPSRVEVLTSLYFKSAVGAATTISGSLTPSILFHTINIRNKALEANYPETTAGNVFTVVAANMADSNEIRLNEVVARLRKAKMEVQGLKDVQEAGEKLGKDFALLVGNGRSRGYTSSSVCRMPLYQVDFGWGKPIKVMMPHPNVENDAIILMDTPSGDGIEANIHMPVKEMAIFEKDEEITEYLEEN